MLALVVEPGNLPSTHLVLTQLLEALQRKRLLDWRLTRERDGDLSTLQGADIVILFRCSELQTIIRAQLAVLSGAIVAYATDDNLLEVPKDTRDGAYFQSIPVRWIVKKLIKMADAVLVYSGFAGNYFSKMNANTFVLELLPATPCHGGMGKNDEVTSEIVVGYAGSASHATDFEPVVPAIKKLIQHIPNLRFDFIGYCPDELAGTDRVSHVHWIGQYEDYLTELARRRWDVGIAPLEDTLFNNCKTNLKFREYAACGIAGVYSDVPLYRGFVRDQENGLLVPNTLQGWYEGIRKLIDRPELRDRIRTAAMQEAKTKYTIEKSSKELVQVLQGLPKGRHGQRSSSFRRVDNLLYSLPRIIGIAVALLCQSIASTRQGTFWEDARQAVERYASHGR